MCYVPHTHENIVYTYVYNEHLHLYIYISTLYVLDHSNYLSIVCCIHIRSSGTMPRMLDKPEQNR